MATTVAQHAVATFSSPVNGTTPIDANTVRGNDNTIRTSYNDHDADTGIHVQSSTLASRPAAGTAGRKWITSGDGGDYHLWFDDGTKWVLVGDQTTQVQVRAAASLTAGQVVKLTGYNTTDKVPEVNVVASAADTAFGLVEVAISSGAIGYVTVMGVVTSVVNTSSFSALDQLYQNGSAGFTATKPTSGVYQPCAVVLRSDASAGSIYVEFMATRIVERTDNTANTIVLRDGSGAFTTGAITSAGLITFASLKGTGSTTVTTILDEDNMATDSATALATQQSIKAYVDTKVTAEDLDFAGGSGTGSVDLDSQTFTIAGTSNEIETAASGQTLTIGLPDDVTIGDDLTLGSDGAVLGFGADTDVTLTHVADTGLLLNGTRQLQFYDASQRIAASSATVMTIAATDEIDLLATAIDINGTVDISGAATLATSLNIASDGATVTGIKDEDDMASNSAVKLATQQSIKAYVDAQITAEDLDFAGDSGTGAVDLDSQTFTIAGTSNEIVTVAGSQTLTISLPDDVTIGNDLTVTRHLDVDGTANLDAVDIDGAVQVDAAITVGVNDTGYDVKFFGATSGAYMLWDESADDLILAGAAGLDVDGVTNLDVVDIDGAVDMASTLQVDGAITSSAGATITVADNSDNLTLTSTDADATAGPNLRLYRNSGSPADNDHLGEISFDGRNDNSQDVIYANIETRIKDASDGSEDGYFDFETMVGGTLSSRMIMNESATIFNEDSLDLDFRIEGNGEANLFFVDAGNDRIGINTNAPTAKLHILQSAADYDSGIKLVGSDSVISGRIWMGGGHLNIDNATAGTGTGLTLEDDGTLTYGGDFLNVSDGLTIIGGTDATKLAFHNAAGTERAFIDISDTILDIDTDSTLIFSPNNSERMRIDSSGRVGIGTAAPGDYYSGSNKFVVANTGGGTGMSIVTNNTSTGRIDFAEGTSGAEQYRGTVAYQHAATEANGYLRLESTGYLRVKTGGSVRLRVESDGITCIGRESGDATTVDGHQFYQGGYYYNYTPAGEVVRWYNTDNGNDVGSIDTSTSSTAYNTSSDRRLKENIETADVSGSLIDGIGIVKHDWISSSDKVRYGVVAQDLFEVFPEAVSRGTDGDLVDGDLVDDESSQPIKQVWGVDYSKLVPLLIKEVQDLRIRVAELEA